MRRLKRQETGVSMGHPAEGRAKDHVYFGLGRTNFVQ